MYAILSVSTKPFTNQSIILTGSEQPAFPDDGVLRIFAMRFCPYAQRVHLILNAKNVPYHTTNINLNEKPDWYLKINPNGKVPAIQLVNDPEKPFLVESLIIAEYLDEKYQVNPLYPRNPLTKAQAKLLIERFAPVQSNFYKAATQPDDCGDALEQLAKALDVYEAVLKERATPYFNGERIGIVDYAIWPWFERLELLPVFHGDKFAWNAERYPVLVSVSSTEIQVFSHILYITTFQFAWKQILLADEAVKKVHLSGDIHAEFLRTRNAGNPNFDLLVQWSDKVSDSSAFKNL